MHSFKDIKDRTWNIAINVNSIKRVRAMADGFDLMKVVEDQSTLSRLTDDPFILVAALYALCQPQADTASVTPEDFGEAMGGDSLDGASTALLAELADFFPPHRRGPMKAAVDKLREIQETAATMATAKIQSPEMTAAVVDLLRRNLDSLPQSLGSSSTSLQASPVLTPAHSPSVN